MNLHRMLLERAANGNPLRIGLIGAGKFGAMYLSQIPTTPGIHLVGIADLSPPRARENLFVAFEGSARAGGTGLGLAIARELVEAHGGKLSFADPPQGARFDIVLPASTRLA